MSAGVCEVCGDTWRDCICDTCAVCGVVPRHGRMEYVGVDCAVCDECADGAVGVSCNGCGDYFDDGAAFDAHVCADSVGE